MAAVLVQVADAVAALLNTVPSPFSQAFTARRSYPTWKIPLTKICGVRVDVVPMGHPVIRPDTRSSTEYECQLIVVIRKKFEQVDRQEETDEGRPIANEPIDDLIQLVEEVHEYLADPDRRQLTNSSNLDATWNETQMQPTYIDTHLQDNAQFTAIIRLTYLAFRDL